MVGPPGVVDVKVAAEFAEEWLGHIKITSPVFKVNDCNHLAFERTGGAAVTLRADQKIVILEPKSRRYYYDFWTLPWKSKPERRSSLLATRC